MDIDEDGHADILSGSYSRMEKGMAGLFQVLYGEKGGTFRPAEVLKGEDGEPLVIPAPEDRVTDRICTRPFAADWDGDGHLDLVAGNFTGTFHWFKGRGKGRFTAKPEELAAGGSPLRVKGAHSDPFVVDWDGDGDLDLLSGSSEGGVSWAENTAGKGKPPALAGFRPLVTPGPKVPYGQLLGEGDLTGPGGATRVWAADVNGDGKLDLLVGDCVTLITRAKGVSAEEYKEKFAQWQKEAETASAAQRKAYEQLESRKDHKEAVAARQKASDEWQKVYDRRTAFMREEMTGYVWLYLRK